MFCTDGLQGILESIHKIYPASKIQRCFVHIQRNTALKSRVKISAKITNDFKNVDRQEYERLAELVNQKHSINVKIKLNFI